MGEDTKKMILLVEDEIMIAQAQKAALEKIGYSVILAETGEIALDIFQHTIEIDLVLMDIDLGEGCDGTETASEMLKVRNVPVVFLSSHTESALVKKTENSTSYGYVVKNSKITVLDASIKTAFKLFDMNKRLLLSEESLSITLQSIGDAVIATDITGAITKMNKTAERLTGWAFCEAENKALLSVFRIVNSETREVLKNPVVQVLERGEIIALSNHTVLISRTGEEYQIADSAAPIRDSQGQIRGVILVFSDVTEKYEAERLLRESFFDLKHSQTIAHTSSWKLTLATGAFTVSEEGLRMFGFVPGTKPTFSDFMSCLSEEDRQRSTDLFKTSVQTAQPFSIETRIARKNTGEIRIIITNVEIQFDIEGHPLSLMGTNQDITERKQVEDKLRESEERYKRITAGLNDYLYTVKVKNGHPVETVHNEACFAITGYTIDDFSWDPYLWINMVVPEEREMVAGRFKKILEGNDLPTFEHRIICKDGTIRWISDTSIPKYDSKGSIVSYDGVIKDISERKKAEEQIKALLVEKELILKEVHHRIKNNMNTINSLLNLQAGTLKDKAAITALEDAGRRVRSMMLLYDKLYRSELFNDMSTAQYLPSLVDEIIVNFPNSRSVTVVKKIDDITMDIKKLQSLGIIINELLTNIMKYAFVGRSLGEITVSANRIGNNVSIIIGDNGNGLPETVDFEHSTGFGLMLVGVLTKQLMGNLRIDRGNGTRIILEFGI